MNKVPVTPKAELTPSKLFSFNYPIGGGQGNFDKVGKMIRRATYTDDGPTIQWFSNPRDREVIKHRVEQIIIEQLKKINPTADISILWSIFSISTMERMSKKEVRGLVMTQEFKMEVEQELNDFLESLLFPLMIERINRNREL